MKMCSETTEKRGENKKKNILVITLAASIIAIVSIVSIVVSILINSEPNGGGG